MDNQDKMLQLVLSDEKLRLLYEYEPSDYTTIEDALDSTNPIIVTIALIIRGIAASTDKAIHKQVYNETVNYLNQNIL